MAARVRLHTLLARGELQRVGGVPPLIIYVDSCPVCPALCEWVMLETSRARRAQCGTGQGLGGISEVKSKGVS